MPKFVKTIRNIADFCERMEPITARSRSLQFERNRIIESIFDLLIMNVADLSRLGILEPLQSLVSDLLDNEMENMDNSVEVSANMARLALEVKVSINA